MGFVLALDILLITHLLYTESFGGKYRLLRFFYTKIILLFKEWRKAVFKHKFYFVSGNLILWIGIATLPIWDSLSVNAIWSFCTGLFSLFLLYIVELEKRPNKRPLWIILSFIFTMILALIFSLDFIKSQEKFEAFLEAYNTSLSIIAIGLTLIFLLIKND